MSLTLQNCFLFFVLLNLVTTINAVPVISAEGLNSTSTNETIPDPVNINGSVAVLDTTLPPVELTTTVEMVNLRNARSEEESVKLDSESPNNPDQERNKSSSIQFPKDDIDTQILNATSASPSSPVAPVIKEDATDSPRDISEEGMESNGTITEGIIEISSSSSTIIDALFNTEKPLATTANATEINSSSTPSSDASIANSGVRVGRSQSDTVEDEINANLTQTLAALTTLSSIINQTSVNDSLVTVV
ncbi:uncharacterized protein LOC107361552 [Tetranychus urticae]|uniref:Uncharacterized protein n=1 Tax=Tetranychus urticae TaxID=32264 RepID=T1K8M5_TETUR|nr:uncharacterized protein LOC107361552 [Tetranychus urticae]